MMGYIIITISLIILIYGTAFLIDPWDWFVIGSQTVLFFVLLTLVVSGMAWGFSLI